MERRRGGRPGPGRPGPRRRAGRLTAPATESPGRLVEASLTATGFHLVRGVSANTRRWWSDAGGRAIGYRPPDDAEAWAARVGEPGPQAREHRLVGGPMTGKPLGG